MIILYMTDVFNRQCTSCVLIGRFPWQPGGFCLTHWGLDKMAAISQTTFQMHFLEWKCLNFNWNFTEVCSQGSNWQFSSIGSDNGLAPNRRQAVIWTNVVQGCRRIDVVLSLSELRLMSIELLGWPVQLDCYFTDMSYFEMFCVTVTSGQ